MSGWIVYSKDGSLERCKLRSLEYGGTAMGERAVTATFDFHSEVAFEVFDYIEYRGERFELEAVPTVKKLSSFEYQYELRFVSLKYELERCEMRDLVPSDNGVVYPTPLTFSFTGDVRYLTDRIQACLDAMYGAGVWKITIAEGTSSEEKNITIAQQNCWNALALVNSTYGLNFYIKGRTITIGGEQPLVSHTFEYGKGNGLYEIERASDTETGIVTKLRAYGSTRNLDYSYPKKPEWSDSVLPVSFALSPLRLMLPSFKADGKTDFVLADNAAIAKYGIREASMVYDDIYPSIAGATYNGQAIDEIKAVDAVDESQKTFVVYLHELGFDLEEHLTTSDAQISMKSGALQGYTFTISSIEKQTGGYKITLGKNSLENSEESGAYVPGVNWNMKAGDKFVLLNILMPQKYIRDAENRLLARANEYLAQYSKTNFSYNIGLHDKFLIQNPSVYDSLIEGSKLKVYDKEIGIDEEVTIQSITITENLEDNILPQVKVTLNNEPSASTLDRIQGKLNEVAAETAANGFTTQSEIMAQYRRKLDKPFFDKLFVAIDANGNEIPSTDVITPIAYIKAKYHVVSVGGFTMYAMDKDVDVPSLASGLPFDGRTIWYNPDTQQIEVIGGTGGGSGEGVSNFWDLSGIPSWITNTKPKYTYSEIEGTPDLTQYALVSQIPSLSGYATESWVLGKSYITSAALGTELGKYVTLDTDQSLKGKKDFKNGLSIDGLEIRKSQDDVVYIDANLVVRGGVTMYAQNEVDIPSIIDSIPTASTTVKGIASFDGAYFSVVNGKVSLIASNVGLNEKELYNYLTSNNYAKKSDIPSIVGYATQSWVENKKYLTAITSAMVTSALGFTPFNAASFTKSNIKSTLGISDWALASSKPSYTTSEVSEGTNLYFTNARAVSALTETLKAYVTLGGAQTITGEKNFTGGLKVNGSPIVYDSTKKYWKLEGDLLVTGGVTMYGSDSSFTPSTIMDAIAVDGTTISKSGGVLKVIGGTGGGGLDITALQNYLTQNSYLNVTSGDNRYLKLSGGNVTGDLSLNQYLRINAWIGSGNGSANFWYDGTQGLVKIEAQGIEVNGYRMLNANNYSSYALPLSGGTLDGVLTLRASNSSSDSWIEFSNKSNSVVHKLGVRRPESTYGLQYYNGSEYYKIWHEGNFTPSDYLPLSGGTITSASPVSVTLNANNDGQTALFLQSKGTNKTYVGWDINRGTCLYDFSSDSHFGILNGIPRFNSNTIWHSGNDGDGSGLEADTIGTYKKDSGEKTIIYGTRSDNSNIRRIYDNGWNLMCQNGSDNGVIATLSSNVASATKLKTARTIWGQSFDGTKDIDGDITIKGALIGKTSTTGNLESYVGNASGGVGGDGALMYAYGSRNLYFYTKSALRMIIESSGNVGIGTTSPTKKLHIYDSNISNDSILLLEKGNAYDSRLELTNSVDSLSIIQQSTGNAFISLRGNHSLIFETSYSARVTIDSSGSVGIGTQNPSKKLHIYSDSSSHDSLVLLEKKGAYDVRFELANSIDALRVIQQSSGNAFISLNGNHSLNLETSNTVRFTIDGSGNVGIGTTSPSYKLDVNGDIATSQYLRVKAWSGYGSGICSMWYNGNTTQLILDSGASFGYHLNVSGNILMSGAGIIGGGLYFTGIGSGTYNKGSIMCNNTYGYEIEAPRATDSATGTALPIFIGWRGGALGIKITSGGNLLANGGITMYSDQRKKTILNHVELSLKQIADAPLIEHYYNSDEKKTTHVGSIAQYWASMNDWFCKKDSEGYYTMEIQNAALASAISIARELDRYETKTDKAIKKLKNRISELEDEVERLKSA